MNGQPGMMGIGPGPGGRRANGWPAVRRGMLAQFFGAILAPPRVYVIDSESGAALSWRALYPLRGGGSVEILRVSLPRWSDPACRVLLRFVQGNRARYVWREASYQGRGTVALYLPERVK